MTAFMFATGIENAYPTIHGGRTPIDEMEACRHYDLWREDFRLVQDELRIRFLRYGPPLHRVWRGPDRYDWSFVDEAFGELRRRDVCLQAPVALPSEHEESFVRRRMEAARRRFNLARQHGAELAEPRAENDWDCVEPGRGARA